MEEKTFFEGQWKAVEKLGEGSFGIVYKAIKEQYGVESYSAIKQIKIPQFDNEYSILKAEGLTQSDIEKIYDNRIRKLIDEIKILNHFKHNENIVSIDDFEVIEKKDKTGKIINIRMELLQNIDDYVMDKTITDQKVLKMAYDILNALEECEEKNVIHRDIKPDNVFVNSRETYQLGGFIEAYMLRTINRPIKRTADYDAPEIYKGERESRSVDIYSLGIMLYKYFNNNRLPFIPDYPNPVTFDDMEKALEKRMNGEEMKAPVKASSNIAKIILKACRYKPEDRYKSVIEFRKDIEKELRAITNPMKLFDFQEELFDDTYIDIELKEDIISIYKVIKENFNIKNYLDIKQILEIHKQKEYSTINDEELIESDIEKFYDTMQLLQTIDNGINDIDVNKRNIDSIILEIDEILKNTCEENFEKSFIRYNIKQVDEYASRIKSELTKLKESLNSRLTQSKESFSHDIQVCPTFYSQRSEELIKELMLLYKNYKKDKLISIYLKKKEDGISSLIQKKLIEKYFEKIQNEVEQEMIKDGILKINKNGKIIYPFGCCHSIWNAEKRLFKERYNIDWKTPAEENPNINYD